MSNSLEGPSQRGVYDGGEGRDSLDYLYPSGYCYERSKDGEKRTSLERKFYFGLRQRECVICLEEYMDGISQVMSLPCGHDFHSECM